MVKTRTGKFLHSLRTQLMLYFIGVSLLVLSVGSYLTYRNMLDMLEQRNEDLVLQQFSQTEQSISSLMEEVNRLSGVFLLKEDVQDFLEISEYALIYRNVEMVRNIQMMADNIIYNYPYIDSIYLFTKNKEVIATSQNSNLTVSKEETEHPFFTTEMFKKAEVASSKSYWYGGYTRYFFNEALALTGTANSYLMTQVKGVRATTVQNSHGIIVFNIKEDYLHSLYNQLENDGENQTYIVDENGKIISGKANIINTVSGIFSKENMAGNYGSMTLNEGKDRRQLIYYRLEKLGWTILKEVPLKIDSEYADSLEKTFIIVLSLSIFAIVLASFFWLKKITDPLDKLARKMADVGQGNLGLTLKHIPKNELGVVIKRFNDMSVSIARLIDENKKIEEERRELEIEALQAQINPHFLYNTLNMIKWMASVIKAKNIVDSLVALGNILRPVFKSKDTMYALKEELDYMQNYVTIMNWRFGNGIEFHIHIPDALLAYKVPRFILQPLLENSIMHGMVSDEGSLLIDIDIEQTEGDLIISVSDNGAGIPSEKLEELSRLLSDSQYGLLTTKDQGSQGIGILNVHKRIRLYYGDGYGISVACPKSGGTVVSLRMPRRIN